MTILTNRESSVFKNYWKTKIAREVFKMKISTNRKSEGFRLKMTILTNWESTVFKNYWKN